MNGRLAWAAAAAGIFAIGAAHAQSREGVYVGAGAGFGLIQSQSTALDTLMGVTPARTIPTKPVGYRGGVAGVFSGGYALGNGLRVELEGNYRDNSQSSNGSASKYGAFVNGFYDIDVGLGWLTPYVGAGVGYEQLHWNNVGLSAATGGYTPWTVKGTDGELAFQAVVGAAVPIDDVLPGLAVTAEYRYLSMPNTRNFNGTQVGAAAPITARVKTGADSSHTIMVGLRYSLGVEPTIPEAPTETPTPPVPTTTAPAATRTFVVYFDWDKASLDARARDIVADAARSSAKLQYTRIEVSGYADRTGTAPHNATLSRRRADAVADELVRWGIPRTAIDIHAYGTENPAVPTAAGVREPKNRRVEIVYQ